MIGGYTEPKGSRTGIGALLLVVQDDDGSLRYVGNVGTGFNERSLMELSERLGGLVTPKSPFANPAKGAGKVHWVRPELLAEVAFASWTHSERIRHAVFRGLRDDKPASAIVQHMARTIPALFVAKSGPRNRVGKVFVDYLRNGLSATTVSAWSARSRPGLGISVPLAWKELETLTSSAQWTVRKVDERLRGGDSPWDGYEGAAVSIASAMRRLQYTPKPS
ncbi:hypothetical protein AVHM3334_02555 [Acidovorax sp. SUPP3334]|nr:hypothetical protein AVHM3334_02555 [Acidovorax sp. SUPP3334]